MLEHPDIQILINNAGIQNNILFDDEHSTSKAIEKEVHINCLAPLLLTRILLPMLRSQVEASIVNITSGLALVPKTNSAVYCGSKGGLRTFTQSLRNQLANSSIRVIEILPPVVETDMTAGRGKNKLPPARVATDIVKAIKRGSNEVYVSKTKILYWLARISPYIAHQIMKKTG